MFRKYCFLILFLVLCVLKSFTQNNTLPRASLSRDSLEQAWLASQPMHTGYGYIPVDKGYVPDSLSALQIGKIILTQIYGKERIESKEPYHVSLRNDVWIITGSLPPLSLGGVPCILLSRKTGAVLSVYHGR